MTGPTYAEKRQIFEHHFLLVFFEHRHGEAEADDGEIHRRAIGGERHDPAALASALITDAPRARASRNATPTAAACRTSCQARL